MKLSHRKKVCYPITIAFLFISLSFFNCGGGGGGSSSSGNGNGSSHSATLTWDAPISNADGTPLTDLAGYKIYYGPSSGNYIVIKDVGNITTYRVENLSPGPYYFAVTAYKSSGNETAFSNEVSKNIP